MQNGALLGVVSDVTLIIGYGLGVLGYWLWIHMGLPVPAPGSTGRRVLEWRPVGMVVVITVLSVWRQVGWQNDVRELFGMEFISPSIWIPILPVTLLLAGLVLVISRSLRALFPRVASWDARYVPERVSRVIGIAVVVVLVARGEFSIVIDVAEGIEADLGTLAACYVMLLAVAGVGTVARDVLDSGCSCRHALRLGVGRDRRVHAAAGLEGLQAGEEHRAEADTQCKVRDTEWLEAEESAERRVEGRELKGDDHGHDRHHEPVGHQSDRADRLGGRARTDRLEDL